MSFNPRLMSLCRTKQGGKTRILWAISRYHRAYNAIDKVSHKPRSPLSSTVLPPLKIQVFWDMTAYRLSNRYRCFVNTCCYTLGVYGIHGTWRYIQGDLNLHQHRCKNLKSRYLLHLCVVATVIKKAWISYDKMLRTGSINRANELLFSNFVHRIILLMKHCVLEACSTSVFR